MACMARSSLRVCAARSTTLHWVLRKSQFPCGHSTGRWLGGGILLMVADQGRGVQRPVILPLSRLRRAAGKIKCDSYDKDAHPPFAVVRAGPLDESQGRSHGGEKDDAGPRIAP